MRLKSITIEGMQNVAEKTYNFDGNLSYLFGKNGAGKSTALKAIQLALLGYIPGLNKTNQAIFRHARHKAMSVTAVIDDNGQEIKIVRCFTSAGSSVSCTSEIFPDTYKIEDIIGDLELPIYNFNEFTKQSANSLKSWFINFLPSADGGIVWEDKLKEALGEDKKIIDETLLPSILDAISKLPETGLELVKKVNDTIKQKISFEKGQLERIQATVQSLVFYDDCDDSIDADALRQEVAQLEQLRTALINYNSVIAHNADINARLATYAPLAASLDEDTDYANRLAKLNADNNELEALNTEITELTGKINALSATIATKSELTRGKGVCPYTKSECSSIKEMLTQIQEEIDRLNTEREEIQVACSALLPKRNTLATAIVGQEKAISQIKENYKNRDSLKNFIKPVDAAPCDMTEAEISEKVNSLYDDIAKAEANKKYTELTNTLTADKFKLENTIDVLKIWDKLTGANGLQTTLMIKPFEELSTDMDKYIHKTFGDTSISTKFVLSEKANSFSFGITRNDKYIPFDLLSSGEQCLYTLALMMCLTSRSSSPLKLILIDDLLDHLDDDNAKSLFESLYNVEDIQFILAGVQKCTIESAPNILIEVK